VYPPRSLWAGYSSHTDDYPAQNALDHGACALAKAVDPLSLTARATPRARQTLEPSAARSSPKAGTERPAALCVPGAIPSVIAVEDVAVGAGMFVGAALLGGGLVLMVARSHLGALLVLGFFLAAMVWHVIATVLMIRRDRRTRLNRIQ
jgi:hypothetical protein